MIRRLLAAGGTTALSVLTLRAATRRASRRLLDAPRVNPDEASLGPALDALGGEVIRLRARDGLRLSGRWLPAESGADDWSPDPHEAILLLHGYTGSVAPDLVEYGPFLRRTAGVLGLDFRGHGQSDDGPSTFGMLEVEDVAGALAWLGERGITRLALVGSSMGGITAIAAVAILGDGSLTAADMDPAAPRAAIAAPRPSIVAVVADSTAPEIEVPVANRMPLPGRRFLAARLFDAAARTLGADLRATEPARVVGLVEPVPLLLIHGEADTTVPIDDARRLVALAGP
ncbi:MAG: alpha/beta hydrolase family protein, partial [Candidatus Limnocylindrales bacterium]